MRCIQSESQLVSLIPDDSHELFMLAHVADAYLEPEYAEVHAQTTAALTGYIEKRIEPSDVHFDREVAKLLLLGLERVITAGRDDYRVAAAKHMQRGAEIWKDELEPLRVDRLRTSGAAPAATDGSLAPVINLSDWRRRRALPSAVLAHLQ